MNSTIAITVIGPDRPGLVSLLSSVVAKHDANWLDSRMTNLSGQFAGVLKVNVAANNLEALTAELQSLEDSGLSATINEISDMTAESSGQRYRIELLGQDRPGIIREITQALANENVAIEELETNTQSASMSGGTLFHAIAELRVPDSITLEQMDLVLHRLSETLAVDIDIEPVNGPT